MRRKVSAVSAKESAHTAQASQGAVRGLIPPIPGLCCLAPCVTTPLYNTIVSRPLRQTLREKGLNNIDPHHQPQAHGGLGDMEEDTSHLTHFSVNGEYTSDIF